MKRTMVVTICLIVLGTVLFFVAQYVLANHGISYDRLSFHLPATATVEGLRIESKALSLRMGTVHAEWSWRALLRGDISVQMVLLRDGEIRVKPISSGSDTTSSSIPLIDIRRATVENVMLLWGNESDSSELFLQSVDAIRVHYDGTFTLDSLVNKGSHYRGNFARQETKKDLQDSLDVNQGLNKGPRSLSIQSIPGFRVGHFAFNDCDFDIQYGEKRYAINQFNLAFSGLNNHNVLDMSLEQLSFRYQDSLDVNLALNAASVDEHNDAHFRNIFLELPGLRVSMPELTLSGNNGFGVAATLDSTYVNTDLINFFYPTLKSWLPPDTKVGLDGRIAWHNGRLTLDHTTLSLDKDGFILGTGFAEFGSRGDSLTLDIHQLNTSLYGISKWSKLAIPVGQANLPVRGAISATGTLYALRSTGNLLIHQTQLQYQGNIRREGNRTTIELSLKSPLVEPKKVLTQWEQDYRVAGLTLSGNGFISGSGERSLRFQYDGDSLYTGTQWMESPRITGSYDRAHAAVTVVSHAQKYSGHVHIKGDIFSTEGFHCAGNVALVIPPVDDARFTGGDLYTSFSGTIVPGTPAADLKLDTIRFNPRSHSAYLSSGHLSASQLPDKTVKVKFNVGSYAAIDVSIGEDFSAWLENEDKLSHFPTANLSMSLDADTTLVSAITGMKARVELKQLSIVSRDENLSIAFSTDTVYWQQFHTHQLAGNMNYRPGSLTGKIETPELITPVTILDSVRFEISTPGDSLFRVALNTFLPEINRPLDLTYHIASLRDSVRISFADSSLLLGANRWQTEKSGALSVSRKLDAFSGSLRITHNAQTASLIGEGRELHWKLEGLDLSHITQTIAAEPAVHGLINASVYANFVEGNYRWEGTLAGASVDTVAFGNLAVSGRITPKAMTVIGQLHDSDYEISGKLEKVRDEESQFNIKVKDVNLAKFSSLLPVPPSTLTVAGMLNADVQGVYGNNLRMKGFVSLPNTEIISSEYDVYLKSDNDSLVLTGTTAELNSFVFRDRLGNPITLDGNVQLAEKAIDIQLKTDKLRLLDRTQQKSTLSGEVNLACDVRIQGRNGDYKVSGNLATLDGASLTYLYKASITLDDREQEMEFVSFTQQDAKVRTRPKRKSRRKPLEWDVKVDVGKIDLTVLFSQVNQDHIKTTAKGKVSFTTGNSAEPSAYGIIESNSGTVAYHVPMISDLRMTIAKAGVRWVGDASKPLLSFSGSQTFRITPNEISSLWTNKTDKWPISVIAKVNDRPLNDLVLDFDLSSTNNQVASWITTLPADTREAYAVSLLVRGRINTGGTADVNILTQTMVSKMNEISSRNIKSADVSFYNESRGANSPDGSSNKIGYSISKGIINKKVRIVVGGSVDLTGRADPSMPDVKVEYVLREDPTITLRAGKANVYTGVIDGNVDESSLGFTYVKRFRNFFKAHKNRKKDED